MIKLEMLKRQNIKGKLHKVLNVFNKSERNRNSKSIENLSDKLIIEEIISDIRTQFGIDDLREIDLHTLAFNYCIRTGEVCVMNFYENHFDVNGMTFSYTSK